MDLRGKRALVVGLGRSGVAATELLAEKGAVVQTTDLKMPDEGTLARLRAWGAEFKLQTPEVFAGAELIVLSPGVPADLEPLAEARRRGVSVIGEVELASWFLQGPVIGVTGSNGKTTTTALIGHILQECGIPAQVGGNIGVPASALVRGSRPEQWNVLELSSFQLETIQRFRARIAVGLNVSPDHLDRHRSFENYVAQKARLFETQQDSDHAVLNADDALCLAWARRTRAAVHRFSLRSGAAEACYDGRRLWLAGEVLMPGEEVPLRGLHNLENTLAAALVAWLAGASHQAIAAAVRTFPGVEHRLEFVARVRGVDFYNDSKATNVDAALKALAAFQSPLWVILGGKDKDSDYGPLREPLRRKARAALLIGAAAEKIAAQLTDAVPLLRCGTLEAAVAEAWKRAQPGETVLLTPACASFDQFENFEHRGRVFKQLVAALAQASGEEV